jgi:hypothetical protein
MTRRTAVLAFCAARALAADSAQEVWDVVTTLAAALGSGDAGEFLSMCDSTAPGYAVLRTNVSALVAQADIESAIDPVQNTGDDRAREMVLDWQLRLVDRTGLQRVTRRSETVRCVLEKRGRKWKALSLDPVGFFAPLSP